jgi:hypothetical protein
MSDNVDPEMEGTVFRKLPNATNVTVEAISTNEHCRIYWTRTQMCDQYESCNRGFGAPIKSAVFELLMAIHGVDHLHGHGYEVWVAKAHSYTWEEIEPKILDILSAVGG